ncbi:MAG: cysteine--tRNA ligase [Gammaproteobacteria bacterium]|nr:cysteine--tRNA ligase [Gammaproteobacteria bacterium]
MTLQLFDSYSRALRDFEPLEGNRVRIYACGPTVYDYAHIGNLRTYLFEDVLRRTLEFCGYEVYHVVNITDVGHLTSDADTGEDKIEKGSRRTGKSAWEIAEIYTEAFQADIRALNILEPHKWCRATDHIEEQIDYIKVIEAKGFTYGTSDGIYFDTSSLENYGHLARLDKEGLSAGERVDVGEKKNPTDFALWKFSPPDQKRQMEWESPWGTGFPGWHIECSAMAAKYLGPMFDIHCGGKDHIPVHHTNEIAQSEVCHGTNLANFWLHGYFLETDQEKMAKSSGEFLRLKTLIDRGIDPIAFRYLCLTANYRTDLKFSWESLDSASRALERLRNLYYSWDNGDGRDTAYIEEFTQKICNDLNTADALALVWELCRSNVPDEVKKATLRFCDRVLGLSLDDWKPPHQTEIPDGVRQLVDYRQKAREQKDWSTADRIRDDLLELGYAIEDTPEGPKVSRINSIISKSEG